MKPKGNERYTTGTVVVNVPKNAPTLAPTMMWLVPPGAKQFDPAWLAQNALASHYPHGHIGEAIQAPIGEYDVFVTGENVPRNGPWEPFGHVIVAGGQTTTLILPVLAPIAVAPAPPEPKLAKLQPVTFAYGPTMLPKAQLSAKLQMPGIFGYKNKVGLLYGSSPFGSEPGIVIAPGGTYQVWGVSSLQSELVVPTQGAAVHTLPQASSGWWQEQDVMVGSSDLAVVSDGSDFPSVSKVTLSWQCSQGNEWGNGDVGFSTNGAVANYVPDGSGRTDLVAPKVAAPKKTMTGKFARTSCRYAIEGLLTGPVEVDSQLPKTALHIGFIDVDNVIVTNDNGTQRTVSGSVTLARVPGQGQAAVPIPGSWLTHNALPVAPGTYVVSVDFAGIDGAKNYTETITIP